MRVPRASAAMAAALMALVALLMAGAAPAQVKMSRSAICHCPDGA